jgi:hypothetical protein
MPKVTKQHALAINKLMIPLINTVAYIDENETDINTLKMYADDIDHNARALCVFNNNLDAGVLHNNIMRQDTLPREHFIAVLRYIENNKLIPSNMFCCV